MAKKKFTKEDIKALRINNESKKKDSPQGGLKDKVYNGIINRYTKFNNEFDFSDQIV